MERRHLPMNGFEISRRFIEVVIADDSLRRAIAADALGDIQFEIDVLNARDDCLPQDRLALLLGAAPTTAIFLAPASDDHRSWTIFNERRQIGSVTDPVQSQLNERRTAFGERLMFEHNHLLASTPNADTDHVRGSFRCDAGCEYGRSLARLRLRPNELSN